MQRFESWQDLFGEIWIKGESAEEDELDWIDILCAEWRVNDLMDSYGGRGRDCERGWEEI